MISQFAIFAVTYYVLSFILGVTYTAKTGLVVLYTLLILMAGLISILAALLPPRTIWRALSLFFKYRSLSEENKDTVDKFQV